MVEVERLEREMESLEEKENIVDMRNKRFWASELKLKCNRYQEEIRDLVSNKLLHMHIGEAVLIQE